MVGQPDISAVILLHDLVILVAVGYFGFIKVWARTVENLFAALARDCMHLCSLRFRVLVSIVTA